MEVLVSPLELFLIGEEIQNGAGNGGYFRGGASTNATNYGGGGGSSYISGHPYCVAIDPFSTEDNIIMKRNSIHYLGYVFKKIQIIDGDSSMPSLNGIYFEIGKSGYGAVKITFLGLYTTKYSIPLNKFSCLVFM